MKQHAFPLALGLFVLMLTCCFGWILTRPSWQISIYNSPGGATVDVYRGDDHLATYSTVLNKRSVSNRLERVEPGHLPSDVAVVTFHDPTLAPGRCILVIDGVELDITETRMIVDKKTKLIPRR